MLKEQGNIPENSPLHAVKKIEIDGKQGELSSHGWWTAPGEKPRRLPIVVSSGGRWERTIDLAVERREEVRYEYLTPGSTVTAIDNVRPVLKKKPICDAKACTFIGETLGVNVWRDSSNFKWLQGDVFSLVVGVECGKGPKSLSTLIEKYVLSTVGAKNYGRVCSFLTEGSCGLIRYIMELANRKNNRSEETDKLIIHELRSVADLSQLGAY